MELGVKRGKSKKTKAEDSWATSDMEDFQIQQ